MSSSSGDDVEALLARAGISKDGLSDKSMERIGTSSIPRAAELQREGGAANRSTGSVVEAVATPIAKPSSASGSATAAAARARGGGGGASSGNSTPLSADDPGLSPSNNSGFSSFSSMGDSAMDSVDFTLESETRPRRSKANDSLSSLGSLGDDSEDESDDDDSRRGSGSRNRNRAHARQHAEFANEIARRDARVSDLHHRNALMERELVRLQRMHESALRQARDTARDEIRVVRQKMGGILRELPQLRAQLRAQKHAITPAALKLSSARYQELLRRPADELTLVEHVAVTVHPLIARRGGEGGAGGATEAERDAAVAEAARLRSLIEHPAGSEGTAAGAADGASAGELKSRLALAKRETALLETRVQELTAREQQAQAELTARDVKVAELEAARERLYAELLRGREERRIAHEQHVSHELEKLRSTAGASSTASADATHRESRALGNAVQQCKDYREEITQLRSENHELIVQRGLASSDAQQTIVELRSDVKLKRYELERLGVAHDEQQQSARKVQLTNDMLQEKVDVISREFNVLHVESAARIAQLEAQLDGEEEEEEGSGSGGLRYAMSPKRVAAATPVSSPGAERSDAGVGTPGGLHVKTSLTPLSTPARSGAKSKTPLRRSHAKAHMRDSAVIALQSELALATERAAEAERSLARERQALEVASATLAQPLKYYLDTIRSRDTQVLAAERAAAQLRVNAAASEKGLELARVRIAALEGDLKAVLEARQDVEDLKSQIEKLRRDDAWGRRAASAVAAAASQGALVEHSKATLAPAPRAVAPAPAATPLQITAAAAPASSPAAAAAIAAGTTAAAAAAALPLPLSTPATPVRARENTQVQLLSPLPSPKTRRPFVMQKQAADAPRFHRRMRMVEEV